MALTKAELEARAGYLGSSDVPALLGCDPFGSIVDVWYQKTRRVQFTPTTSTAATLGDDLEPCLVRIVARDLKQRLRRNYRVTHECGYLSAQCDGWMPELGEPIEAKTSGLENPRFDSREWGDGPDAVPYRVLAQVQFCLALTNAPRGHVVALLGQGRGLRRYVIERNERLIAEILRRAHAFWNDHVLADVRPDGVPTIETMKDVRREEGKRVEVHADLIDEYQSVKEQAALVKVALELKKTEVLEALGDAEVGFSPLGSFEYRPDKNGKRSLRVKGARE